MVDGELFLLGEFYISCTLIFMYAYIPYSKLTNCYISEKHAKHYEGTLKPGIRNSGITE